MAQVVLKNIAKHYDNKIAVIQGIDLTIRDGEFIVFVGPSGCGKSTLLRMIAGLEDISGGELFIGDKLANHIPPAQRGLAMVFQSYALYPHMSVFENMAFGLKLSGQKRPEVEAAVQRAADILQINHLLQRKPKELSGGQRQRVAIGRAIVRKPHLFLFDEPLSNLDASLRVQMRVELSRLHQELKTTMIYVTHDQVEAMTLGERIVVFNGGRIEQVGSPLDLYNNPETLFVAGFLGAPKMNFLRAEIVGLTEQVAIVRLSDATVVEVGVRGANASIGDRVTLGIRAEHLSIATSESDHSNRVDVRIDLIEHLGDVAIVYVELDGASEMIAVKQAVELAGLKAGETTRVRIPAQHCHLFDAAGVAFERLPVAGIG